MTALERLTRKRDFERILSLGKASRKNGLTVLALPNELGCIRLGISIPKRLVPLATRRNLLRRLIRKNVRSNADSLVPLDIMVILKAKTDPQIVHSSLTALLSGLTSAKPGS